MDHQISRVGPGFVVIQTSAKAQTLFYERWGPSGNIYASDIAITYQYHNRKERSYLRSIIFTKQVASVNASGRHSSSIHLSDGTFVFLSVPFDALFHALQAAERAKVAMEFAAMTRRHGAQLASGCAKSKTPNAEACLSSERAVAPSGGARAWLGRLLWGTSESSSDPMSTTPGNVQESSANLVSCGDPNRTLEDGEETTHEVDNLPSSTPDAKPTDAPEVVPGAPKSQVDETHHLSPVEGPSPEPEVKEPSCTTEVQQPSIGEEQPSDTTLGVFLLCFACTSSPLREPLFFGGGVVGLG